MRRANAFVALFLLLITPALSTPSRFIDLTSSESVLRWINIYRSKPDPAGVPAVIKALAGFGAFKDPEQAGVYVGFLAGVIGTNPERWRR